MTRKTPAPLPAIPENSETGLSQEEETKLKHYLSGMLGRTNPFVEIQKNTFSFVELKDSAAIAITVSMPKQSSLKSLDAAKTLKAEITQATKIGRLSEEDLEAVKTKQKNTVIVISKNDLPILIGCSSTNEINFSGSSNENAHGAKARENKKTIPNCLFYMTVVLAVVIPPVGIPLLCGLLCWWKSAKNKNTNADTVVSSRSSLLSKNSDRNYGTHSVADKSVPTVNTGDKQAATTGSVLPYPQA